MVTECRVWSVLPHFRYERIFFCHQLPQQIILGFITFKLPETINKRLPQTIADLESNETATNARR